METSMSVWHTIRRWCWRHQHRSSIRSNSDDGDINIGMAYDPAVTMETSTSALHRSSSYVVTITDGWRSIRRWYSEHHSRSGVRSDGNDGDITVSLAYDASVIEQTSLSPLEFDPALMSCPSPSVRRFSYDVALPPVLPPTMWLGRRAYCIFKNNFNIS
jgi:hypothetical protein